MAVNLNTGNNNQNGVFEEIDTPSQGDRGANLEPLTLSPNNITSLPEDIFDGLYNLQRLKLNPTEITDLQRLKLNPNEITDLGDSLSGLQAPKFLRDAYNKQLDHYKRQIDEVRDALAALKVPQNIGDLREKETIELTDGTVFEFQMLLNASGSEVHSIQKGNIVQPHIEVVQPHIEEVD